MVRSFITFIMERIFARMNRLRMVRLSAYVESTGEMEYQIFSWETSKEETRR
jgi:hypothetical protein